jgi:hypothetical protein
MSSMSIIMIVCFYLVLSTAAANARDVFGSDTIEIIGRNLIAILN